MFLRQTVLPIRVRLAAESSGLPGDRQTLTTDGVTGRTVITNTPLPENQAWVDDVAHLRAEMAVAQQFGNLTLAKGGLSRVLALPEILSTIPPPPDFDDADSKTAKE